MAATYASTRLVRLRRVGVCGGCTRVAIEKLQPQSQCSELGGFSTPQCGQRIDRRSYVGDQVPPWSRDSHLPVLWQARRRRPEALIGGA